MAKYDLISPDGTLLKINEYIEGYLVFKEETGCSVIYESECINKVVAVIPPNILIIEIK